jgi:hypothetical protein
MPEDAPFDGPEDIEATKVPLKGPNVISTFDTPPHPDAVKAHDAAIRRHLQDKRPPGPQPDGGLSQDS